MYGFYYSAGKMWEDVRLWEATKHHTPIDIQVADYIGKHVYWNIGTFKDYAEEMKLVLKADYSFPIIIDQRHRIVDGAHRVVHAYLDGVLTIKAVVIKDEEFPVPDYDESEAVEKAYEKSSKN